MQDAKTCLLDVLNFWRNEEAMEHSIGVMLGGGIILEAPFKEAAASAQFSLKNAEQSCGIDEFRRSEVHFLLEATDSQRHSTQERLEALHQASRAFIGAVRNAWGAK